jgi:hypothetical protein
MKILSKNLQLQQYNVLEQQRKEQDAETRQLIQMDDVICINNL